MVISFFGGIYNFYEDLMKVISFFFRKGYIYIGFFFYVIFEGLGIF